MFFHQIKGGKQSTFGKCPTAWPLATQWHCLCVVFNLEELCPVFWWLCPAQKEGLCPNDHCRVLRVWYPIQSVLRRNRGKKPVVHEGPFWEGTQWTSWEDCDTYARERWPQTPQGGLGIFKEEVCDLTLLTGWANCMTIFLCQGHGPFLWYH